MNTYEAEVEDLLATLQAAGWKLHSVDNGDGYLPVRDDAKLAASEILAVDDCRLKVESPTGLHGLIYIVLGNDAGELVADYTLTPGLDEHRVLWSLVPSAYRLGPAGEVVCKSHPRQESFST